MHIFNDTKMDAKTYADWIGLNKTGILRKLIYHVLSENALFDSIVSPLIADEFVRPEHRKELKEVFYVLLDELTVSGAVERRNGKIVLMKGGKVSLMDDERRAARSLARLSGELRSPDEAAQYLNDRDVIKPISLARRAVECLVEKDVLYKDGDFYHVEA